MRRKFKNGLSMLLAVSMVLGSTPVGAQDTAKSAVVGVVSKEATAKKQTTNVKRNSLKKKANEEKYAKGQAVILYDKSKTNAAKAATASIGGDIEIVHTYDFEPANTAKANSTVTNGGISVSLVKSDTYSTEKLVELLNQRSDIKYAQPNYKIKSSAVGTDTYKDFQWALDNQGQNDGTEGFDINADALFNAETDGEERVIALVDTGIDYTHEDLTDVVWTNPYESKKFKGKHGYDFINFDDDPIDDNGHGTHCSGIMAASMGNGVGIAGVANNENIKIMGLKILDELGYGYGYEAVGAYNYIYKAQQLGVNVVAVNNSWGMGEEDYILGELIDLVGENGALTVCAAGNDSMDNDEYGSWPANYESPYVISVAASTENDELAPFSNYGISSVDIAAPGTSILSSVSYNNFNPGIYENPDEICSIMYDFSDGNLVKTLDDDGFIDAEVKSGDISYGIHTFDGEGNVSVALSEDSYFGPKDQNNKSLEWKIEGAKAGDVYYLYFPYITEKAGLSYSSLAVKANGPEGEIIFDPFWGEISTSSEIYVADGPLNDKGVYNEDEEYYNYGALVGEIECWGMADNVAIVEKDEKRAVAVQLYIGVDGDYIVNVDNFGIAKSDVDEEDYGKYAFYSGTSMATPHVTAAVAAVSGVYSDESQLDIKARILGSTRRSEALEGKIMTGGVLDLSYVDNPNMSIESIYRDEERMVFINGYYLAGAEVFVDGVEVEILEEEKDYIAIDGTDFANKTVEISIVKGEYTLTYSKFFAEGEYFEYGMSYGVELYGGNVVSAGNSMYYVDGNGYVYKGIPVEAEEMKTLEWESLYGGYDPYLFGDDYSYAMDYTLTNQGNVIYADGKLWSVVTIDVGYSEETALLCFESESESWVAVNDLPAEMEEVEGYTVAAYNGEVYLFGGYDDATHTYNKGVFKYNANKSQWSEVSELPEGRVYAKALQMDDKLIVTLGGTQDNAVCKNMVYDGETWTVTEADMGTSNETEMVILDEGTEYETYVEVISAQIGLVEDGLVYTDITVEGLGDTFIYNLSEDAYMSSGYILDKESLYCNELYATTVKDELYVLYGYSYDDEDWYEDWASKSEYDDDSFYDDEEDWYTYLDILVMPVSTGFGSVTDESEEGVFVTGGEYYVPGEDITITADAEKDYFVKGMTVNGKKARKENGVYTYTVKDADGAEIVAVAQAGAYVTEVNIPETITIKQGEKAQLSVEVLPENADNKNIIWYSESNEVLVDSNGVITVGVNAIPGKEYIVRASSQDREYPMGQCVVVVEKAEEETTTSPKEETTAPKEETTTGNNEQASSPSVGSKVTVGKNTYKVLTNTEDNRTVSFVGLKSKKDTKATVPSTVVIEGKTYKVTEVASNAFKKCKKLKKVTIGKNVTAIGKYAFNGCKKLNTVTIKSTKLTVIKKKAFKNANKKLVIKVPKKNKKAYKKMIKKSGFKGKVK